MGAAERALQRDQLGLHADCSRCFALCCVALTLKKSADFPFDKRADDPCRNLTADFGCGVHATLRTSGYRGCTTYDCLGAGQQISQVMFAGRDWRDNPGTASLMFQLLPAMRDLHVLQWLLAEAIDRTPDRQTGTVLRDFLDAAQEVGRSTPDDLSWSAVVRLRAAAEGSLRAVSAVVRASAVQQMSAANARRGRDLRGADLRGADLAAADLQGADLTGADLSEAQLTGADLRGATLVGADLLDADLRGTRLDGADLSDPVFLTQAQVNAAQGDEQTQLVGGFARPDHWRTGPR